MDTVKLLVTREMARVVVVIEKELSDYLTNMITPYAEINNSSIYNNSDWTIFAGRENSQDISKYQIIVKESPGEPDNVLLIDLESKHIIVDQIKDEWKLMYTFRMIRNLLRWQMYTQNFFYLHGGIVEVDGVGVAYVGRKKCGKTSSILAMLLQNDVKYVTNDDLTLQISTEGVRALGWPRSIGVRIETLKAFEPYEPMYIKSINMLSHPGNRDKIGHLEQGYLPESIYFTPKELVSISKKSIASETRLDYIIFPRFCIHKDEKEHIQQVDPTVALKILLENLEYYPDKHSTFLSKSFALPEESYLIEQLRYISINIPCYYLYQHFSGLHKGANLVRELIQKGHSKFV